MFSSSVLIELLSLYFISGFDKRNNKIYFILNIYYY
jgi:hypothetical protein